MRNSSHVRDFDNRIRVSLSQKISPIVVRKSSNIILLSLWHYRSLRELYFYLRERRSYAIRFIKFPDRYRRALHFSRWPSSRSAAPLDPAIPEYFSRCRKQTRDATACWLPRPRCNCNGHALNSHGGCNALLGSRIFTKDGCSTWPHRRRDSRAFIGRRTSREMRNYTVSRHHVMGVIGSRNSESFVECCRSFSSWHVSHPSLW